MTQLLYLLTSLFFTIYSGGVTRISPLYTNGFLIGGEISIFTPDSFSHVTLSVSTSFYGFKEPYYEYYRQRYELNIVKASANLSEFSIGYQKDFVRKQNKWGWELSTGLSLLSYDLTFPEADVNLGGTIVPVWGGGAWVRAKYHRWERKKSSYGIWAALGIYKGSFEALYPAMVDTSWARVDRRGEIPWLPRASAGITLSIRD